MTFSPRWFLFLFLCVGGLFSPSSPAKIFRAHYVHFQMNYPWTCQMFGINWVCHHSFSKGSPPAMILTVAEEGDPLDRLDMYRHSLNEFSSYIGGKKHLKQTVISHHVWLEGFYESHFFEGSLSKYAVAICCEHEKRKIHVMVSLHGSRENYSKYSSEFLHIIRSLRLTKDITETLNQIRKQTKEQRQAMLSYIEKILSETDLEEDIEAPNLREKQNSFKVLLIFALFFLLALSGVFFFLYKKQARKKLRKKASRRRKKRVKPKNNISS